MLPGLLLGVALFAGRRPASAQGTFEALESYSTDGTTREISGTLGWTFDPSTYITVTALGCFTNALDNNGQSMEVGLWAADGSLLASNLITTISAAVGLSRYEPITPVFLNPGETYYLGAYSPSGFTSLETYIPGTTAPLVVAPDIMLGGLASTNAGFAFPPAEQGTGGDVYLGANFQFQQGVPEPSSVGLFALGVCAAAISRGRSRR